MTVMTRWSPACVPPAGDPWRRPKEAGGASGRRRESHQVATSVRPGWSLTLWTGLMPDIIRSLCCRHRRFRSGAQPRTRRSEAQETAVAPDEPEVAACEAKRRARQDRLGNADELAGQGLADEEEVAPPLDLARERTRRTLWSASYQGSAR